MATARQLRPRSLLVPGPASVCLRHVSWEELEQLTGGDHWTIRTAVQRVEAAGYADPWRNWYLHYYYPNEATAWPSCQENGTIAGLNFAGASMANLANFPATEREAFTNACRRHGFIAADFSVCDTLEAVSTPHRMVSILRPDTGALKQYAAGPRESWPAAFEKDLAIETFGPAPE